MVRDPQTRPEVGELEAAEATDAAVAATWLGLSRSDLEAGFGSEAAASAEIASALVRGRPLPPQPETGFVESLRVEVCSVFDSRPVRTGWRLPTSRLGRTTELAVAGSLAAVIAVAAFLMGAAEILNGPATAVPTANAETSTATVATPAAKATDPGSDRAVSQGWPPDARQEKHQAVVPPAIEGSDLERQSIYPHTTRSHSEATMGDPLREPPSAAATPDSSKPPLLGPLAPRHDARYAHRPRRA